MQFGVVPTEFHRQRADPLWCTSAGGLTAALMYPRCDVIGDRAGDYVQGAQNLIRARLGLPAKVAPLQRKVRYSNMYQYHLDGPIGVPPAASIVDDVVEDLAKGYYTKLH